MAMQQCAAGTLRSDLVSAHHRNAHARKIFCIATIKFILLLVQGRHRREAVPSRFYDVLSIISF